MVAMASPCCPPQSWSAPESSSSSGALGYQLPVVRTSTIGESFDVGQIVTRTTTVWPAVRDVTETCPERHLPRGEIRRGARREEKLGIPDQGRRQGEYLPHPLEYSVDLASHGQP